MSARQAGARRRIPKTKEKPYRHELKYYINAGDYTLLRQRLNAAMEHDENAGETGEYHIRSLYFDDPANTALREKLSGVDKRDKIRIRIYNLSDKVIKLECKHKKDGFIQKDSISLSREECERLCRGDYTFLLRRSEPFARRMFVKFASEGLRPAVIVDYVREAFVFPAEDVRITFDKDVRTAYRSTDIFNTNLTTYPVTEYPMVLEVKFNHYLPTYIRELVQTSASIRSAISKYCLCRKFEF